MLLGNLEKETCGKSQVIGTIGNEKGKGRKGKRNDMESSPDLSAKTRSNRDMCYTLQRRR